MRLDVKHPNTQGLLSLLCSCLGLLVLPLLAYVTFERFNAREGAIPYVPGSSRLMAVVGLTGVAGMLGLIGFGLGVKTIGHVRNDHQGRSWAGFLLGAFGMVGAALLFLAFYMLKERVITSS